MRISPFVILAMLAIAPWAKGQPATQPASLRTGDEGMWTLNNLPMKDLKERYDFVPTPEWIRHVQLGAVRFNDGGSGAFVSGEGLVITNHHVALGQLQKMSSAERNYVRDGFFARRRSQEMRCPDLELNVLVSMEDVTKRVLGAVDPKASDEEQNKQRKAEIARITKESTEQTKLRSDVVELYQGGEYWLYRYKKYTDVRLVMAPELQAAFFGGDPDNFTYPRYCLDFAFFRVYENDAPAKIEHYFKWSKAGPQEGELVFVAGHPGSTDRLDTVSELEYARDYSLPTAIQMRTRLRKSLYEYAARGPEQARQVQDRIFGVENAIKALVGSYEGLKDPATMGRLTAAETALRQQVMSRPDLADTAGAWDRIATAMKEASQRHKQLAYYPLAGSRLAGMAGQIVRYVVEVEKPNDKRYPEYRDSNLESLQLRLFSPAPIYPELEEYLLANTLTSAREALEGDDKLIRAALDGREPTAVAHELITGTKLADPVYRKELVQGGRKAVEQSSDPLIVWARKLDDIWREQRDWYENTIESVATLEGGKIARARFAIYGRETYPDATFTLRLSYGRVMGYELGTTQVPYKTNFYGLFGRSASFDNKAPFNLAPTVERRREKIELSTPLNFVSTNDIIGGNSGSPVLNRQGEYVGLIFDGNIQSLVWRYVYTDKVGRAIAVHSSAIEEALKEIYRMPELVKELRGK
ncbi:MAG TPA: S46 family peptidase [Tepidisphaeraceae bacterium]|nr:S46 family peptidase [Tepidisphaeraceae bacterium]